MELTEKAEKYAVGKANAAIDKAIAQAYVDGYRAGYKDREEEIPIDLRNNKTEFVDLGLPSGTLWSRDYERKENGILYLPYEKACKLSIPTKEQWTELKENCRFENQYERNVLVGTVCVGPNGNKIVFATTGLLKACGFTDARKIYMWLNEELKGNDKIAVQVQNGGNFEEVFCGFLLPVRLIRNK